MIYYDAIDYVVNGHRVEDLYCNTVHLWPLNYNSFTIEFNITPVASNNICLNGFGWGHEIGYIHLENVNYAMYDDNGTWTALTNTEISYAVSDTTSSLQKYCRAMYFNLKSAHNLGRFSEFTFKTDEYYAPTCDIEVKVYGCRTGMTDILLASKVITQAPNTTYHLYLGDFN